ncbi:cytochrome P450 [Daldinia loculata]|uniref:cytochrome P450 n=1 Tax=Daldinia loculata TaxID=103429 RepID=UPI0020C4D7B7|nr:cytochrome P450 [Daldinia loculata]KAI1645029.1 cytochrome P450 [Daldinia loculata]
MMSFFGVAFLGGVVSVYMFLRALLYFTQDAKEPQSIAHTIPFISPIFGMAAKKANFYSVMRDKYNLPLYTLRMPGSRIYVINSTSLIPAVQRQFRTLAFTALESRLARDLMGVSKSTHDIISHNLVRDEGYLMTFPKFIHSAVSAGPGLDAMNRRSVEVLAESLDRLSGKGPTTTKMFEWTRHELLIATTEGVYGPNNPFRDPAMEDAWYKFEPGIMMFVLKLWPQFLAKQSFEAREYMGKVWERYFESGAYKKGSELVQCRVKINEDFQIPIKETAKIEVGGSFAILANTLPATFWMTYHIFSDPVVLEDIRTELYEHVKEVDGICTIDLADVKGSCPILLSTFKEMFRYNAIGVSARIAMEDHMLDNKYLIKKGSTVMIPSRVQHSVPSVWGETANEFYHKRFIRQPGIKAPNPIAFRGFGGGTTLCPGRHFASTEVLMFSALMALRFDIRPVGGRWLRPTTDKSPLVAAVPVPDWDINVEIRPRDSRKWNVSYSGCNTDMEISAEDIGGVKLDAPQ